MKEERDVSVMTADDNVLYIIPESHILEVQDNGDGTSTLACVNIIHVKNPVDFIREQLSRKQKREIRWLTKSQPS